MNKGLLMLIKLKMDKCETVTGPGLLWNQSLEMLELVDEGSSVEHEHTIEDTLGSLG